MSIAKKLISEVAEDYNGWKNRQTWNVSLWITNDEHLYDMAKGCKSYFDFVKKVVNGSGGKTPDGVSWTDKELDIKRLDQLIKEL